VTARPTWEELSLWDGWAPPMGPDENSKAAAVSIVEVGGSIRRACAAFIRDYGPAAEWEVAEGLGLIRQTTTPRIYELHRAGIITRLQVKGRTPSGRACWRYVVTEAGRRALAS
jgi:predicted transcriptional regulator